MGSAESNMHEALMS